MFSRIAPAAMRFIDTPPLRKLEKKDGPTDLKSYAEHEQDKAEILDKINYLEIAGEAEMSHKDTDKQYERHSK